MWRILAVVGFALALIGWTDLALLWWPTRFGTAVWEFGTITAHLAGMPLPTIGLVMLSVVLIARQSARAARAVAVFCALIALGLIAMTVLYALDLPEVWNNVSGAGRTALIKAMLKTVVYGAIYLPLHLWLCRLLWHRT